MKAVVIFLVVFILFDVLYGLAYVGIIPVSKLAGNSPVATKILIALKLEKPQKNKKGKSLNSKHMDAQAPTAAGPSANELNDQKIALDAEMAQIQKEKAMLSQKTQAAKAINAAPVFIPTSDKIVNIYDTMKPDDLARIFEKMSDASVADALSRMDEGKAGKVLVAMPVDRTAKLTALMNRVASEAQPPKAASQ